MRVHPDWCPKRDDPLAVELWKSKRPALLEVRCGKLAHRLAKVYAANGKRWLNMPGFDYIEQFLEQGDRDHLGSIAHAHAALTDLDTLERDELLRCSHGMYTIRPPHIRDALERGLKTVVAAWAGKSVV